MAKPTTEYICSSCNASTRKWSGCCLSCGEWNTLSERAVAPKPAADSKTVSTKTIAATVPAAPLTTLDQVAMPTNQQRLMSGLSEWDQVVGGGLMPGAFIILTGDPGIGKSTLLLQVAAGIARNVSPAFEPGPSNTGSRVKPGKTDSEQASMTKKKVIYFSSEESLSQVKQRGQRLDLSSPAFEPGAENSGSRVKPGTSLANIHCSDAASLDTIVATAIAEKPDLLIVDSIQNCYLSESERMLPGSVAQLRQAGFTLMKLAKEHGITVIVTGHITKEGNMAGPKVLEHLVDGVFYLQGEDRWHVRILRAVKNRFGTINEMGFFEMGEHGMDAISNINKHLLSESTHAPGAALTCSMEGTRPLLLELQALCVPTKFSMPQRVITGVDPKRVLLIAAILEKYLHTKFSGVDIFFRVSSGCTIKESASDLGIALALLSSYFQQPLPEKSIALAEISLTGQLKPVPMMARRLNEAGKFGLKHCFMAANSLPGREPGPRKMDPGSSPGKTHNSASEKTGEKEIASNESSLKAICFKSIYELLRLFPEKE
ncbi:MAG: AAA family ATPase [Candidatus Dependentiae bacterium]|jgi:DNA repair protein RadA/Sms